jgi:hypothetical protein
LRHQQLSEAVMQMSTPTSSHLAAQRAVWCVVSGALMSLAAATQAQVLADPQSAWQPDPQKRIALTLNSHVVHQPLTWQPRGGNLELNSAPTNQASLNLEFRRKSSTQSAKDLLKVQLTAESALNFRPRGGGMVVTYRSQF